MRRLPSDQRLDSLPVRMEQRELKVADRSITYGMLVPREGPPESGYPLIVGLHFGTTMEPGLSPYFGLGFVGQLVYPAFKDLNAVIVAPDAPEFSWAHPDSEAAVLAVVAEVKKDVRVDVRKTLVTGFSMGGQGAWFMAATHADLFRAAIPVSAAPVTRPVRTKAELESVRKDLASGSDWATPLLRTPLYVIQSRADQVVDPAGVEQAVQTLKGRGADVTLTMLDDIPHSLVSGFIDPLAAATPWLERVWSR